MGRIIRGGRVVPAERAEALMSVDDIVDEARREATSVTLAAREEADAIREQARVEGLREAQEEATASIVAASSKKEQLLGDVQQDVVILAMEVARKVIRRELQLDQETLLEVCKEVLQQVVLAQSATLKVNPDDLEVVQQREGLLSGVLAKGTSFRIMSDVSIERGGCVVESDMGKIDARLETQLAAIERALLAEDG